MGGNGGAAEAKTELRETCTATPMGCFRVWSLKAKARALRAKPQRQESILHWAHPLLEGNRDLYLLQEQVEPEGV